MIGPKGDGSEGAQRQMTRVYVVGVGMTSFGKFPEVSVRELTRRAATAALKDAACDASVVKAAFFANAAQGVIEGQHSIRGEVALQDFAFDNIPVVNVENACASGATAINMAYCHIKAGASDVVLAAGAEKLFADNHDKSFEVFKGSWDVHRTDSTLAGLNAMAADAEAPGMTGDPGDRSLFMDVYAAFAKFHMRRFGTTVRQFAAVSAKNHRHSVMNPQAQYRKPYTVDEVLAARVVSWPLTLPMCAPISDGAAAVLLCSESALRHFGRRRAIEMRTSILASGGKRTYDEPEKDLSRIAAKRAYEQAAVAPAEIDVAEVHDATAVGEIQQVENLMLCEFGEGGPMAERGETTLGGRIPVNPSGGLESKGHPIGATGLGQIHELTLQLRGEAGLRQVEGARLALAENGGGLIGIEGAVVGVTILGR